MSTAESGRTPTPESMIFDEMGSWQPWNWVEAADRIEDMVAFGPINAQRKAMNCAVAMLDLQMDFVSRRLHADMECAANMMACASPMGLADVTSAFWGQLVSDYSQHAEAVSACLSDNLKEFEEDTRDEEGVSEKAENPQEKANYAARRKPAASSHSTRARAA